MRWCLCSEVIICGGGLESIGVLRMRPAIVRDPVAQTRAQVSKRCAGTLASSSRSRDARLFTELERDARARVRLGSMRRGCGRAVDSAETREMVVVRPADVVDLHLDQTIAPSSGSSTPPRTAA